MPKIVVSYRRADTGPIAGRIFDRLSIQYGIESVFMDVDNIPFGVDFREHIQRELSLCDVLVVIIGPRWMGKGEGGKTRLEDETDPVRIEVETAMRSRIPIIPILVDHATMPKPAALPASLRDFAFRNAAEVDAAGRDFRQHMDRVIRSVDRILEEKAKAPVAAVKPVEIATVRGSQPAAANVDRGAETTTAVPLRSGRASGRTHVWVAAGALAAGIGAIALWGATQFAGDPKRASPTVVETKGGAAPESAAPPPQASAQVQPVVQPPPPVQPRPTVDPQPTVQPQPAVQPAIVPPPVDPFIRTLEGHTQDVNSVAYSADRRLLISASDDKTIRLWEPTTGRQAGSVEGHTGYVFAVAFSPDGRRFVSASQDQTVRLWEADTHRPVRTLTGHTDAVLSVAYSPDGRQIASAGSDKTIKLWNADTGTLVATLSGHAGAPVSLAFFPNRGWLASAGGGDKTLRIWDLESRQVLRIIELRTEVRSVTVSRDGRWIAAGGGDGKVRVWDSASGALVRTLEGHSNWVGSVAFRPDGLRLASGSSDNSIRIWDTQAWELVRTLRGHARTVKSIAFTSDNRELASGSYDKTIRIWHADVLPAGN